VQFTPPGSPASIQLAAAPLHFLVVSDIEAARAELIKRGIDVSEVFHPGPNGRVRGPIRIGRVTVRLRHSTIRTAMLG
jgi:hypothetical protein